MLDYIKSTAQTFLEGTSVNIGSYTVPVTPATGTLASLAVEAISLGLYSCVANQKGFLATAAKAFLVLLAVTAAAFSTITASAILAPLAVQYAFVALGFAAVNANLLLGLQITAGLATFALSIASHARAFVKAGLLTQTQPQQA